MEEWNDPQYEVYCCEKEAECEQASWGIRAKNAQGEILRCIPDVSSYRERIENIVRVYNENGLLLECFEEMTERVIGVLI